jgi:hypothetical protein
MHWTQQRKAWIEGDWLVWPGKIVPLSCLQTLLLCRSAYGTAAQQGYEQHQGFDAAYGSGGYGYGYSSAADAGYAGYGTGMATGHPHGYAYDPYAYTYGAGGYGASGAPPTAYGTAGGGSALGGDAAGVYADPFAANPFATTSPAALVAPEYSWIGHLGTFLQRACTVL